jgi:hypothetical protein
MCILFGVVVPVPTVTDFSFRRTRSSRVEGVGMRERTQL